MLGQTVLKGNPDCWAFSSRFFFFLYFALDNSELLALVFATKKVDFLLRLALLAPSTPPSRGLPLARRPDMYINYRGLAAKKTKVTQPSKLFCHLTIRVDPKLYRKTLSCKIQGQVQKRGIIRPSAKPDSKNLYSGQLDTVDRPSENVRPSSFLD
jgi:hypothetical protein